MAIARLKTSRARLLAILIGVMTPVALIMAAAAWSNYRFTAAGIDRDYALLTANYSSRLRVWLRGTERGLAATVAGVLPFSENATECEQAARRIVTSISHYRALYIRFGNGMSCRAAGEQFDFSSNRVSTFEKEATNGLKYEPVGDLIAQTRLHFSAYPGRDVVFYSSIPAGPGQPEAVAMLVVDVTLLENTIAFGERYPGATIAAVLADGRVVAAQGQEASATGWQPGDRPTGSQGRRWEGRGVDGVNRIYASRPVIGEGLYIVGSFPPDDFSQARTQFWLLMALPGLVILALMMAFLKAIDLYVVDWLKQLEWTARERLSLPETRVELSEKMPQEIRSFASAFNDMADAEAARRKALEGALDENRFLLRELHHRVKNSLQVIQSYLALTRRGQSGPARDALIDAELRVQVLSHAYRIALADGVIRDVNLGDFLSQMAHTAASATFSRAQAARLAPPAAKVTLELEKVIALGFLLSDLFIRASATEPQFVLTLILTASTDETALTIIADRPMTLPPEARINRGLQIQLDARAIPADPAANIVGGWRWRQANAAADGVAIQSAAISV